MIDTGLLIMKSYMKTRANPLMTELCRKEKPTYDGTWRVKEKKTWFRHKSWNTTLQRNEAKANMLSEVLNWIV